MAVTAHFGETIHYNAFTDVTSITDAVRADLEEKGFNITVGAYPVEILNAITIEDTTTQIKNLFKWNPDEQKITMPTLDEVINAGKGLGISASDSFTYVVDITFNTTYINPSGSTTEIAPAEVLINVENGS